jgi:hypothetical protein
MFDRNRGLVNGDDPLRRKQKGLSGVPALRRESRGGRPDRAGPPLPSLTFIRKFGASKNLGPCAAARAALLQARPWQRTWATTEMGGGAGETLVAYPT